MATTSAKSRPEGAESSKKVSIDEYKLFNDSVHYNVRLHPLLVKLIDTPTFQRLRNIKQMGLAYLVYPGASHNRFEHSIGTAHLAGKLVRMLRQKQKDLGITDVDVLCVEIAGLCHDLGHGPFSHLFDHKFLPMVKKTSQHEERSCDMFDYMLKEEKSVRAEMDECGLGETDFTFIKEMIKPKEIIGSEWPYKGRGQEKRFLYEIISNKRNEVDVDKWDYFARDRHHCGVRYAFQSERFMLNLKVLENDDGEKVICARQKEHMNLFEMFHDRNTLHRKVCMHHIVKLIEEMMCEALTKADNFIKIPGSDGSYSLSETIHHPDAFVHLTDDVWGKIMRSKKPELKEAQEILLRIIHRDLYHVVKKWEHLSKKEADDAVASFKQFQKANPDLNLIYIETKIDFGKGDKNPISGYFFYDENWENNKPKCAPIPEEKLSNLLPKKFEEFTVIVYCKEESELELAKELFKDWCSDSPVLAKQKIDRVKRRRMQETPRRLRPRK